jgi:hypothetical protein
MGFNLHFSPGGPFTELVAFDLPDEIGHLQWDEWITGIARYAARCR